MSSSDRLPDQPHLLLIISDQERATQHFPPAWERRNLPYLSRLKRRGLTFERAFCNACMCTPSRATLFTGRYPAQHGCVDTLSDGGVFSPTETVLDPAIENLAQMLRGGGYQVHYRGKWHLSKGSDGTTSGLSSADVATYGFDGWIAPDAGQDVQPVNFGGGYPDHDGKYTDQAVAFLESVDASQPFCLVYALVNPHDVLAYPGGGWNDYGYTQVDIEGDIGLPASHDEDLAANDKPAAQAQSLVAFAGLGPLPTDQDKTRYVNFYGNLLKRTDTNMGRVLDALEHRSLTQSTIVIRTADHGEMAMAHGGLRQKIFNVYEESIRVPLVFSNPVLFRRRESTEALASLVDLLPTIASLAQVDTDAGVQGRDLSPILTDSEQAVQDDIVFTYDDVRAGQPNNKELLAAADRIRCIREERWKYARYFHADGTYREEFEMYDLQADPDEMENLAHSQDPVVLRERERLAEKLAEAEERISVEARG